MSRVAPKALSMAARIISVLWPTARMRRKRPCLTLQRQRSLQPQSRSTPNILANELAEQHQLNKGQTLKMMEDLIGMITKHLIVGERVKIVGLGILQVRNCAARMGRNPATGEPIQIKASKKVAFRASKELKEAV